MILLRLAEAKGLSEARKKGNAFMARDKLKAALAKKESASTVDDGAKSC